MADAQPEDAMNLRLLREIYHRAEGCPPADRARLLDEACGTDAALRAEVESLLAAGERAGAFLAEPTMDFEPHKDALAGHAALPFPAIGPYRLVERIGEGGYGEVFLAEQSEPVRRRVALKMLKAGLDTRQVLARFEAERQTLAMMDHPGIARIFDAGTTPQGRPYFVMELVDGVPLTEFCMLRKVSPRERLALFCAVCRAVQHAHAKGVIHRDLKPSNILVSESDGQPRAVVIDFGIAKAMRGLDAGSTLHTGLRQLMGTPAYMSPEQAGLEGPDVDTRSDIYSLGVLLYELLTGVTPFDASQLRAAALAEVQRRLNEEVPSKPSTRVASLHTQATQTGLRADFAAPVRLLKGDLDWIVMKALEKEPGRRYATAAAFAEDIVRHLGHEPVTAGPPSVLYRLRKWTRRNRAAAAAAGVMLLATAIAAGGLVRGFVIAKREAAARKVQAERAESLLALQTQIFESANPESGAGSDYTVRQLLEDFSVRFRDPLGVEPEVEISLRHTVGRAWQMLGGSNRPEIMETAPSERESSDLAQAETHFRAALELAIAAQGPDTVLTAECRQRLAWLLRDRGFYQKAAEELRPAVAAFSMLRGPTAPQTLSAKAMLATVLLRLDEREEALRLAREAAAWPADSPEAVQPLQLAARVCLSAGDRATAATAGERALHIARAQPGKADGPRVIQPMLTLAEVRAADGHRGEAVMLGETAHRIARDTFGEKHPETSKAMLRLTALRETVAAAAPDSDAAARTLRTAIGDGHPDTIAGMAALMSTVKKEQAREIAERFAGVPRGGRESGAPVMVQKLPAWIQGLVDGDRLKDFEGVTRGVIEMSKKTWGEDHLNTLDAERILAEMYVSQKEYDKALGVLVPNLEKTRRSLGDTHPLTTEGLILTARAQNWRRDFAALEPLLEECARLLPGIPQTATAGYHWSWLGDICISRNRYQKAADCYARAAPLLAEKEHAEALLPARLQQMRAVQMTGRSVEASNICRQNLQLVRDFLPPEDPKRSATEYSIITSLANTLLWRAAEPEVPVLMAASERKALPETQQRALRSLAQSITSRIRLREQEAGKDRTAWEQAAAQHGPLDPQTLAALRTWTASCGNAGGIPALDDALAALDAFSAAEDALLRAEAACEAAWYRALFRSLSAEEALTVFRTHASAVPGGTWSAGGLRVVNRIYSFARYSGHMAAAAPLIDAACDRMSGTVWPAEKTLTLVPRFSPWIQGNTEADSGTDWRTAPDFHPPDWGVKELPLGNAARYAPASLFDSLLPFFSDRPFLLRTTFTIADPASLSALKLRLRCADGAVVWINGREAVRRRVMENVTFAGHATAEPSAPEPDLCVILPLEPSLLQPGVNVISAAVYHTEKRTGPSAALFDCVLEGLRK